MGLFTLDKLDTDKYSIVLAWPKILAHLLPKGKFSGDKLWADSSHHVTDYTNQKPEDESMDENFGKVIIFAVVKTEYLTGLKDSLEEWMTGTARVEVTVSGKKYQLPKFNRDEYLGSVMFYREAMKASGVDWSSKIALGAEDLQSGEDMIAKEMKIQQVSESGPAKNVVQRVDKDELFKKKFEVMDTSKDLKPLNTNELESGMRKERNDLDVNGPFYHELWEANNSMAPSDLPDIVGYILSLTLNDERYIKANSTIAAAYKKATERITEPDYLKGTVTATMTKQVLAKIPWGSGTESLKNYPGYGVHRVVDYKGGVVTVAHKAFESVNFNTTRFGALLKKLVGEDDYGLSRDVWLSIGSMIQADLAATHSEIQSALYINSGYSIWRTTTKHPSGVPEMQELLRELYKKPETYVQLLNLVSLHSATCGLWFQILKEKDSEYPDTIDLRMYALKPASGESWMKCFGAVSEMEGPSNIALNAVRIKFPTILMMPLIGYPALRVNAFSDFKYRSKGDNFTFAMNQIINKAKNNSALSEATLNESREKFNSFYCAMFIVGKIWVNQSKSVDLILASAMNAVKEEKTDKKKNDKSKQPTSAQAMVY